MFFLYNIIGDYMNKKTNGVLFFGTLFFIVDQILKIFISSKFYLNQTKVLIPNFFNITLVHNTGAAFNILTGNRVLLIVIGVTAFIGLLIYLRRYDSLTDMDILTYSLLLGGIMGNLIDRIFHGYVIDYISLIFNGKYFPVFNFADICIVVSIILLICTTLKEDLWK